MNFRLLLFIVIMMIAVSCNDTLEDYSPNDQGTAYFPLATGHSWTYQLDSVLFDNNGFKVDTVSHQIREEITEAYSDSSGKQAFKIVRSAFKDNSWVITDIWTSSMDEMLAYRWEENLRFAKLSFPVKEGVSWDGNAFIDENIFIKIAGEPIKVFQNWGDYSYTSVGQAETIGEHSYDQVATVSQADLEDRISKRFSIEKYAYGKGLVYREMIILNTQKFESTEPWEKKAEEGFILTQTLLNFEPGE